MINSRRVSVSKKCVTSQLIEEKTLEFIQRGGKIKKIEFGILKDSKPLTKRWINETNVPKKLNKNIHK